MTERGHRVLLTGATSLVGAEVLRELLGRKEVASIRLLMPDGDGAWLARLADYLGPLPDSVTTLAGSPWLPRFGLAPDDWEDLGRSIEIGIHCAQRDALDDSLQPAREVNVGPVDHWIELLGRNHEIRLHHLSTAFVGGTRRGLFTEFDLDCGQGFHNAFERSAFEAEVRLRQSRISDRVTIYRPSHLLGRAGSGDAFRLGGAYPLLATLAASSVLPGDTRARLDFIPADYVAAAIVALALTEATGTFHLACGWNASLTVRQAASLAAKACGRSRGALLLPRIASPALRLAGSSSRGHLASRRLAFKTARDLLGQGPVFDAFLADLSLGPLGLVCPQPNRWIETVVQSAERSGWKASPIVEQRDTSAANSQQSAILSRTDGEASQMP